MQENAPQWDPGAIHGVVPWEIKLFLLFLLFTLVFLLIRSGQISWFLWRSRKCNSEAQKCTETFGHGIAVASIRAMSIKKGAAVTFLLSLFVSAEQGCELLGSITTVKVFGPAALAGRGSEILAASAMGLGISCALYGVFALFDGRISRLKLGLEHR